MPEPDVTPGLAAVRSWCGWHIAPSRTETVKVEGEGSRVLLLPSLHVTDVTAVRDEDAVPVTDFKWRANGVVRGFWACEVEYAADIVHGYDTIPPELQAIIDQLDADGVGAQSLKSRTAGPFSEAYGASAADLESQPISVRAVVGRYRIPARP